MEDCLKKAMQMFQVSCYDWLLINVFKLWYCIKMFMKERKMEDSQTEQGKRKLQKKVSVTIVSRTGTG